MKKSDWRNDIPQSASQTAPFRQGAKGLVGKTLGYAARKTGFRPKGYRLYLLQSADDRDGVRLAEDYELTRILRQRPKLNRARVISVEEYYGTLILRVTPHPPPSGAPSPQGEGVVEGGAEHG